MTRITLICALFTACLFSAGVTPAATLHFPGTDSTTEIRSVFNKKTLYLNLADAAAKLTITLKQDTSAGLLILCTPQNCVPVFEQDQDEVQIEDKALFVRTDEIASALGCTATVKKKRDVFLACPAGLPKGRVGNQVGDLAPGFRLPVDTLSTVGLPDVLKRASVMVVFFRNGDWDPFSKLLLKMLEANLDSVRALGYNLVAIHGYEAKPAMKWTKDLALTFPLLADQYSAVIRAYDVLDRGRLAVPSVFVIDRRGVIRLRHIFDLSGPPDLAPVLESLGH